MMSPSLTRWFLPVVLLGAVGAADMAWGLSSEQISGIRAKLQNSHRPQKASAVSSPSMARRIDTAIVSARNLLGRVYDQTMGCDNGRNYAAGQIVCVDVPRLALLDAGVSLAEILKEDARLHPSRYPVEKSGDNLPNHPNFSRRTRNWMRWCMANGRLLPPTATPKPGDVVFYGPIHIAFVYAVDPDGHYRIVECAPTTGHCLEQGDWMMDLRGWKATGFGRILPLPQQYARLLTPPKAVAAIAPDPKWTIEQQIDSHPGMGMMAGIFSRLHGKPLPKTLVATAKASAKSSTRTRVAINMPAKAGALAKPVEDIPADQKAYLAAEMVSSVPPPGAPTVEAKAKAKKSAPHAKSKAASKKGKAAGKKTKTAHKVAVKKPAPQKTGSAD